jgi:hypothetical protein
MCLQKKFFPKLTIIKEDRTKAGLVEKKRLVMAAATKHLEEAKQTTKKLEEAKQQSKVREV